MYYESETGVKNLSGLFSKWTVVVLALLVTLTGIYLVFNYFSPDILAANESGKIALQDKIETEEVSGEYDFLRIPAIGLERQVVDKNTEGKIQMTVSNNSIILSGRYRTLGITPVDTIVFSPFALVDNLKTGQKIYLDYKRERLVYEIESIILKQSPGITNENDDLIIYALNHDGSVAEVAIIAKKQGQVGVKSE